MSQGILIRNAHSILTGLPGQDARSAAQDIRIHNGVITEMGQQLTRHDNDRVLDARDCGT